MQSTLPQPQDATTLENLQEQRDEILVLQSIYNTDDDEKLKMISCVDEDDQGVFSMVISVRIKPVSDAILVTVATRSEDKEELTGASAMPEKPKDVLALQQSVKMNRSMSGRKWEGSFEVKYLAPLLIYITFPPSYPSHNLPDYHLSCGWLSPLQAQSLSTTLNQMWTETASMPIVFTWIDWLENNALENLDITDHLVLHGYQDEDVVTSDKEEFVDVMIPWEDDIGNLVAYLIQYNREIEDVEFCQNQHICEVCFDEKPGTEFFKLGECSHVFCHECMRAFCELHVKDGTVEELRCPDTKCNSLMPPYIIEAVLDPVAYLRWEKLLLLKTLDAMGDTVYCPRCQSLVIVEEEEHLHLAQCTVCYFAFCTLCKMCWHQGSSCDADDDDNKLEAAKKQQSNTNGKLAEQRKYDEIVKKLEEDIASKKFVSKQTRNCPSCKIPVEKIGGCNKMNCKCGKSFCWLCGNQINGYAHFRESKCILFPGQQQADFQRALPPEAVLRMRARLAINPQLHNNQAQCPMCKQKNLRANNNNHIKCWNCKGNFCFQCTSRILGTVTDHFKGPCVQHSS